MPSAEALSGWLALEPEVLLRQCDQLPFQGPGPGGQKRNRVYSGVRLRHAGSGLSAEASERREARRNLEDALHRLRLGMALALPVPESPGNGSSGAGSEGQDPGSGSARAGSAAVLSGRREADPVAAEPAPVPVPGGIAFRPGANPSHVDFPRFAFAAMLALETNRARLAEAAAVLGCSASALTRFLAADKRVWARAQEARKRNGLHPLKT